MSVYKKLIVKSNDWYDDLPESKRSLLFLFVLLPLLLVTNFFFVVYSTPLPFLTLIMLFSTWRVSKVLYNWIDDYKKLNK